LVSVKAALRRSCAKRIAQQTTVTGELGLIGRANQHGVLPGVGRHTETLAGVGLIRTVQMPCPSFSALFSIDKYDKHP